MKNILILFTIILFFSCERKPSSCSPNKFENLPDSGVVSTLSTNKSLNSGKAEEDSLLANKTLIEIVPSVYDFGRIPKNTPVTASFTIKNTGKKPLIISETVSSCGCTVPEKPSAPILPGDSTKIKVTFTSEPSQVGQNIYKKITVIGNFPGNYKSVAISGHVKS